MIKKILVSQNGWKYAGVIIVEAENVEVLPNVNKYGHAENNVLLVNGAKLTFDEEIKIGK
jgi:hypothetical protein